MSKTNTTGTVKVTIQGTPLEAGEGVWQKLVLPCFSALKNEPPQRVQMFYTGLLSSCMGSMVADFGHEKAVNILRTLADTLDAMRDEMAGSSKH